MRATTAQLYHGRATFELDQRHVTKNQPITVLILLCESLAITTTYISILGLKGFNKTTNKEEITAVTNHTPAPSNDFLIL